MLNLLKKLWHKQINRPMVRRSCRLSVEALDERVLPSTTALLVKDINPPTTSAYSVPSSNPANLTNFNGTLFFTAADATHGVELWKSDGTDAGTVMVKDIRIGSAGSAPANLTVVGSTLYFTADDGTNGVELWKSDGTNGGTCLVRHIRAGATGSTPSNLTKVGTTLYFTADDGVSGRELWKSNGTNIGTVLVRDIKPGATSSAPANLTAVASTLYLTADDGVHGMELWKSNGTTAGTVLQNVNVPDFFGFDIGSSPRQLTAVGSTLYFVADLRSYNDEPDHDLRLMSASVGSTFISTVSSWPERNAQFENLTNFNDTNLCFFHRSSGTPDFALCQVGQTNLCIPEVRPAPMSQMNGCLYFSPYVTTGWSLWKFDGTAVTQEATINAPGSTWSMHMTNIGGMLYFTGDDGINGDELWQSNGTSAGTRMVRNINTAGSPSHFVGSGGHAYPSSFANVNDTLFFAANNGFLGTELWKTRANTAPSVNPILANIGYLEGTTMSVVTSFSDADGDAVTFSASGLPAGMSINRLTGTITGTLAYSAGRQTPYTVTVTGSDVCENSSVSFSWTVRDVTAPTIVNPGIQGNNEGNVVSLAISASDPHGDALTYSAIALPMGLAINTSTGVISGTLAGQAAGSYLVTVTATDGVNPVTTSFTWNVGDLTVPTITNPGPQRNNRGNTVSLTISASDAEGDALTYTALNLPLGLSIDPKTGRISGTISPTARSSYDVTIQVCDGTNTSSIVFTWTVG